jgi:hypothetical protein
MRIPLVLALFLAFIATPAVAACQLDSNDFAALRLSVSGIADRQAADALPDDQKLALCTTRELMRKIRSANNTYVGTAKPEYWPYFLSPEEKTIAIKAVNAWIIRVLPGDRRTEH